MNQTFSILFFIVKSKAKPDGSVPIYLRITIDGRRSEIASKRYVSPDKWNSVSQKVHGNTESVKAINSFLKTMEQQVFDAYKELMEEHAMVTAESLKNRLTGNEQRQRMLIEIVRHHNDCIEKLIGKDYSKPTLTKYNTTKSHLQDFIKWKYRISDINIDQLDFEFLSNFEFYLKTEKKVGHNTTAKYISNTRKIINECISKGWLKNDPFRNYKIKVHETTPIFLTEEELEKIETKEFSIKRLSLVKDMFIFSCYTGLSFIDVTNLTPHQISTGIDGKKWIFTRRQKEDTASNIPLLPKVMDIIKKYADDPKSVNKGRLLPMLSNQKMNAYLKEIADLCGINKELTYHCARHTFATTVTLSNGIPIESVSKMLGHKKIQTTQHYAKILDKKVSLDMDILFNKYSKKEDAEEKDAVAG